MAGSCHRAIKQARLQLAILMGMDANRPFSIRGELSEYEGSMYSDLLDINANYSSNSSLLLNEIQTHQLERALKVQQASLYPTLSVSANYNWTSMSNGSPLRNFRWTPYSTAGLTLSVPLFTGGSRYRRRLSGKSVWCQS